MNRFLLIAAIVGGISITSVAGITLYNKTTEAEQDRLATKIAAETMDAQNAKAEAEKEAILKHKCKLWKGTEVMKERCAKYR